jgi:hypothetical protein
MNMNQTKYHVVCCPCHGICKYLQSACFSDKYELEFNEFNVEFDDIFIRQNRIARAKPTMVALEKM